MVRMITVSVRIIETRYKYFRVSTKVRNFNGRSRSRSHGVSMRQRHRVKFRVDVATVVEI